MGEDLKHWVRVPVGPEAARWATRGRCRRVLLVVHNVTAATRLIDVLPLFRDDLRLQVLATCTGSSPFRSGVAELLASVGVPVLPWEQALATPVDLAISASFGGQLGDLKGTLTVLSHGVGYNKTLTAPNTEHRTPNTGRRTPDAVFGLGPEWILTAEGTPIADAMVFSHPEQIDRLAKSCPEALPTAVLAGDPCFDRILAARHHRDRYRRALGVHPGQRLVLLNSTWNPTSLFGDSGPEDVLPLLLPRLTSELPADEYRVAAVLHPNIWHGHGPGQVRLWLDRARRAGLALVDPLEGWRQALIAADVVLGDFGSVSYYAAACGTPVLLGATDPEALGTESPVAAFVRSAPRLDPYRALPPQLDRLLSEHRPANGPTELTSSAPGDSAALLRGLFYRLIGITEPAAPAVLDPLPLPPYEPPLRTAPLLVLTSTAADGTITVRRFAEPRYEPDDARGEAGAGGHLAVHEDTLDPGVLASADIILRYGEPDDPRFGSPGEWAAEVLDRYRSASLAAYITGPRECEVLHRGGLRCRLTSDSAGDPAVHASALLARLHTGPEVTAPVPSTLTVATGTRLARVRLTVDREAHREGTGRAARPGR
ncbi:hypothetical protein [Kitasatospora purpeofusca]|uniref:hypothetical protein n=1 Tax=Kitasatospora purpeofusca TaxID=67352 RepID=UPI00224D0B7D|nr:hypothetical protein [Kitasatospora purpeofusca]MCX4754115.1 hypothetical protein [Kitasatospora purpeofusca]WSR33559.1 hypothetical protein OG715_22805 [Kitasatospora purpeofusca]